MKLAAWYFLPVGVGIAVIVALTLVFGGFRARQAISRFGEDERVRSLLTFNPAKRRTYKGVLLVVAVLLSFFAAAQPQYCLLYTSPSPRDLSTSRMPSSA